MSCYDPCLGATAKPNGMSRSMTEIVKHKTRDQSGSQMKSFGHVNGIAVRPLSTPNIPSTISECRSLKTSVENCQQSDMRPSSLTRCGVTTLPVNSTESSAAANGHPAGHLPQSSTVLKSKIPNSCKVTSASATHDIHGSQKMSNGECTLKQCKDSPYESCCGKTLPNGCANKTLSVHHVPVQPGGGCELTGTEVVKRSPTKWNCCVNMHKKDVTKTCSSSGEVNHEVPIVGGFSPTKFDSSTRRTRRRRAKKLSTTTSCHSTTNWRVTRCSDADVLLRSHDTVHATTAWSVSDIAVESSVTAADDGDDVSAVRQSDVSATCNDAVHGGQQRVMNGVTVSHHKIKDKHRTSVKHNVNCMYAMCRT